MNNSEDTSYLWDRSGEPDAEVARLETLLAQLRQHRRAAGASGTRPSSARRQRAWTTGAFAAAAAALIVAAAWLGFAGMRRGWSVQSNGRNAGY